MIVDIDGVLISEEIIQNNFVCDLNSCKGACCWEGDYGAPVEKNEEASILSNLENIKTYLSEKSINEIEVHGAFDDYDNNRKRGTRLHKDGSCVFLTTDEDGIAKCGIEKAYQDQKSTVNKPISCHLYPIRIVKDPHTQFESWYYDKWDICSAACKLGNKLNIPIYQFVKNAIIRYKGNDFYERLHDAAQHLIEKKTEL